MAINETSSKFPKFISTLSRCQIPESGVSTQRRVITSITPAVIKQRRRTGVKREPQLDQKRVKSPQKTLMSHTLAGTRDRSRTSGGGGGGGSTAPEKPNDQTQQHHFIVTRAHTHLSLGRSAADNDEANKAKTIFSPGMEKRIAPLVPRVCSDPCVCLGACRALHMPSGAAHCICNKSSPASRSQCFKETDATSAPLCVTG